MQEVTKVSPKDFLNKVLTGTAQGTIIALIANAVLSAILSYFSSNHYILMVIQAAVILQLATPLIIGGLIAKQFNFDPMRIMVIAGAAFVGSGVIKYDPAIAAYVGKGTGDVINIMLTSAIAVLATLWIKINLVLHLLFSFQ